MLKLVIADGDGHFDNDHSDWADARIECAEGALDALLPDAESSADAGPADASPDVDGGEPKGTYYLSDRNWIGTPTNAWGPVERDMSNGDLQLGDGNPIRIGGIEYQKGLGAHAESTIEYALGGTCQTFSADVGVDDEVGSAYGSVVFEVLGDGNRFYRSPDRIGGIAPSTSPSMSPAFRGCNWC